LESHRATAFFVRGVKATCFRWRL